MRYHRIIVLPLIIALLLNMLPCSLADQTDQTVKQGYGSMADYTKVRWFAQCEGLKAELNGEPNQDEHLEVNAAPGTTWAVSAEFVKVRNGQLLPYRGELDVSRYCEWTTEGLTLDGYSVTLPETEGVYTVTGRFVDDEGNLYTCDITFNVSEENRDASRSDKRQLRTRSAQTVEEKVAQLAEQCRAQGYTTEYDIALWLHDWLIYNANYDYTYSNYNADGVLLKGTGVCDSYSKAFQLLLNEFQIENQRVISVEMNHAWNLVKLDGIWCHIDCTWDDPGTGGDENHTYFGMNASLMGRDHQWNGSYPSANSLSNYYPVREGMLCYSTDSELDAILSERAASETEEITVVYTGLDANQTTMAAILAWIGKNNWKYGIVGYSVHGSTYICTLEATYDEPWEQPENHLETPVDAPNFKLDSPVGRYILENYAQNGIVLVFGRTTCGNTRGLLSMLSTHLDDVYACGVDVLVSMYDAVEPEDLQGIETAYPGYHFTYASEVMWNYLNAVGYQTNNGVTFPCVFVINREGKITYYSTGYIADINGLLGEAYAVATSNALPEPEKHQNIEPMLNGTGNVNDIKSGESILSAVQSAAANKNVILQIGYNFNAALLDYFENHYSLFNKLGFTMIASFVNISNENKASYPHCSFVEYSNNDFWKLQFATGHDGLSSASYTFNLLITKGGDIAAYTKGTTLNLNNCALAVARRLDYDATIPTSLSVIEDRTFLGTAFSRLDLSNGSLTEIRSGAFANCGSLEVVRIPEGVTTIADDAFANCDPIIICTIGTAGYRFARAKGLDYICE